MNTIPIYIIIICIQITRNAAVSATNAGVPPASACVLPHRPARCHPGLPPAATTRQPAGAARNGTPLPGNGSLNAHFTYYSDDIEKHTITAITFRKIRSRLTPSHISITAIQKLNTSLAPTNAAHRNLNFSIRSFLIAIHFSILNIFNKAARNNGIPLQMLP